ncbi:MAG: hypothetical protein FJX72_21560, partial [Armatimonadetes bacterium]|nr:hypothetical protein [Armatimonadota bacterium]
MGRPIATMLTRSGRWAALAFATLLAACVSEAATQDDVLRRDQRLRREVTICAAGVCVAEIANSLAQQTGVPVCADEESGASDVRVLVWASRIEAWRVMQALKSLLSYRQAPWLWESQGNGTGQGYVLRQTRAAQELPHRLADHAQRMFETDVAQASQASRPSAGRRSVRLADPAPLSVNERAEWGLSLFTECLPGDMQQSVLRGEQRPVVRVADLPGWGRRFTEELYTEFGSYTRTRDGQLQRRPMPEWIRFSADRLGAKATRSLYIDGDGLGGYAYAGGLPLQAEFARDLRDL